MTATTTKGMILTALVAFVLALAAALVLTATAHAAERPYVHDDYGLFSSSELNRLESAAADVSAEGGIPTYLVIVGDIGSYGANSYARAYFDSYELGSGSARDGVLFLVAVDSRDYVTITHGQATTVYTDYRLYQMEDEIVPHLSEGDWFEAGMAFFDACSTTTEFYEENDEPLDSYNDPGDAAFNLMMRLGIIVIGSLVIASVVVFSMRSRMRSAHAAVAAGTYQDAQSLNIRDGNDTLVNVTVSKTPRVQASSGGGGGGMRGSTISGGFGGTRGGKF